MREKREFSGVGRINHKTHTRHTLYASIKKAVRRYTHLSIQLDNLHSQGKFPYDKRVELQLQHIINKTVLRMSSFQTGKICFTLHSRQIQQHMNLFLCHFPRILTHSSYIYDIPISIILNCNWLEIKYSLKYNWIFHATSSPSSFSKLEMKLLFIHDALYQ